MARAEFTKAVKVAVIKRATINGVVICEECQSLAKSWDIDHIDPDGLTGKPTLENARLLCKPCHVEKTKADVANIARAKRREAKHVGAVKPKAAIQSAGFAKSDKTPKRPVKIVPVNNSPIARMWRAQQEASE